MQNSVLWRRGHGAMHAFFFLPVNILTVWSPAFLAARHTTVCLDVHACLLIFETCFYYYYITQMAMSY